MLKVKSITLKLNPYNRFNKKVYRKYLKYHNSKLTYKSNFINQLYTYRMYKKFNIFISPLAKIAGMIEFPHPIGIVIGTGVEIGKNCTIYQNVTLGRKNKDIDKYPKIGNNVVIYAGSVIIGDIKIGNNVIIGANSLVLSDIPDNCIVAGNPARIIKRGDKDEN